MSITFDIPGVRQNRVRLPRIPVAESIHHLTTVTSFRSVEGPGGGLSFEPIRAPFVPFEAVCDVEDGVYDAGVHPFVGAVQVAFDQHLPLEISPDHVWLVLAQGYARHVRLHAEALRHRFVQHEGRDEISVRRDDFVKGDPGNPWPEVFDEFADELRQRIGKRHDLLVADFSTSGPLERAASQLVLMDAMGGYFEYAFASACGIPRVTLEGTPADWRSIRDRARALAEEELGWWIKPLGPILDGLVDASTGEFDRDFWCSMYKLNNASGGPYITGWLQLLFPYLEDRRAGTPVRNPGLGTWRKGLEAEFGGGPTSQQIHGGLSSVPFEWRYLDERHDMTFIGGFVGVAQDESTGTVSPRLGWAVRERAR